MFVRFGKTVVVLALVAMLGAQWAVLQTVAWTAMLAENLHGAPVHEALVKTFDGKHPCCLCKAIAAGKKSEQKKEFTTQMQRLEFPPPADKPALTAPAQFQLLPATEASSDLLPQQPPSPPPRGSFT